MSRKPWMKAFGFEEKDLPYDNDTILDFLCDKTSPELTQEILETANVNRELLKELMSLSGGTTGRINTEKLYVLAGNHEVSAYGTDLHEDSFD